MSFEIDGKLHKIFETESKSETFKTRDIILHVSEGQYPQFIKFQLTQDRTDLIEPFNEGDQIKVHFDLRGREWNGKYFTNLNAWRLERSSTTGQDAENVDQPFPSEENMPIDELDDLPF